MSTRPLSSAASPALARRAAVLLAAAVLAGCSTVSDRINPSVDVAQPTSMRPPEPATTGAATGSIFQSASYRPMFEDYRARMVGDTITVRITEQISSSASSASKVDKKGSLNAGISALPGLGINAAKAQATASTANNFDGKGSTQNSNNFSGTITATVIEVLPNGHLIISGEKQIGVNRNVDVLRFSGQVDPRAIQSGNTVASTSIANVRLEHRGRGAPADANEIGWVQRFFLSVLPL